ncbi:MAG: lipid-A-disaccharide synthase [Candidatus Aminicenantes bacterium]|nr:lipid-A-disaccharide synthase [Candidatus Aminicenantes bacterium]
MRNVLLVAAENSAETYAVQIVRECAAGGDFRFWGIGGDRLAACGFENVVHNRSLAVVGIIEVLAHIWRIRGIMKRVFREARRRRADAALLIDYPDFNLRLARRLSRAGIPVYYYISPTVWAWRYGRVAQLRRWVKHLFIIFPFEVPIYEKEGMPFTYTGHPLLSEVRPSTSREDFRRRHGVADGDVLLALLPGSRESEVRLLLPEIMGAVRRLGGEFRLKVFLQQAQNISAASLAPSGNGVRVLGQQQGHDLLNASDVVITTCGTSNLEAALLGAPFVAVYRVNRLTYLLGRRFLRIGLYSIVNILAGRPLAAELIQKECRAERIYQEARALLTDEARRQEMRREFRRIAGMLRQDERPAAIICRRLRSDLEGSETKNRDA